MSPATCWLPTPWPAKPFRSAPTPSAFSALCGFHSNVAPRRAGQRKHSENWQGNSPAPSLDARHAQREGRLHHPRLMKHLSRTRLQATRMAAFVLALLAAPFTVPALDLGVARIDVTPAEPIRLTGYGRRTTNSVGVEQRLWAKALAIGSDAEGPALLLTLDNCGISEGTYRALTARMATLGVKQDRLAISCSHTHTGPCTTDWAPNIFSSD